MQIQPVHGRIRLPALLLLTGAALALGACNSQTTATSHEGIGFRQERHAEVMAMRAWRECRDEGLALDANARRTRDGARYLAAARTLESCEAELGPEGGGLAQEERMKAYALAVQDRFKGGDIAGARRGLETFQRSFPGADLRDPDGASWIETMEILLGLRDRTAVGTFSTANVSGELKSELRRVRYWTRN